MSSKEWWLNYKALQSTPIDCFTQIQNLTLENYSDAPERYRQLLRTYSNSIQNQLSFYANLGFETPSLTVDDLQILPAGSFFFYLPFKLFTPYISKDDEQLYVHDNPVHKDWVLKVPTVSATSWKGVFRSTFRCLWKTDDKDPRIIRFLGNPNGNDKSFTRGRLNFFSTFFDCIGEEVINPQDRKRSAGTDPITIECVPINGCGVLALLYVPFEIDPMTETREFWYREIRYISRAIRYIRMVSGFGAKTASGMGRMGELMKDKAYLVCHLPDAVSPSKITRCYQLSTFSGLETIVKSIKETTGVDHD